MSRFAPDFHGPVHSELLAGGRRLVHLAWSRPCQIGFVETRECWTRMAAGSWFRSYSRAYCWVEVSCLSLVTLGPTGEKLVSNVVSAVDLAGILSSFLALAMSSLSASCLSSCARKGDIRSHTRLPGRQSSRNREHSSSLYLIYRLVSLLCSRRMVAPNSYNILKSDER